MPITLFSPISVVATNDIGGLGPKEGEPVLHSGHLTWFGLRFAPWAAFLAFLLLYRASHRGAGALVLPLIPVFPLKLLVQYVCKTYAVRAGVMRAAEVDILGGVIEALAIGIGLLCIMGFSRGLRRWSVALRQAGILIVVGILTGVCFHGITARRASYELSVHCLFYALLVIGIMPATWLAVTLARRHFTLLRLACSLFACLFAFALGISFLCHAFHVLRPDALPLALVATVSLWAFLLPFAVLAFKSGFYRSRFERLFED